MNLYKHIILTECSSFTEKFVDNLQPNYFKKPKDSYTNFTISHYAGKVILLFYYLGTVHYLLGVRDRCFGVRDKDFF